MVGREGGGGSLFWQQMKYHKSFTDKFYSQLLLTSFTDKSYWQVQPKLCSRANIQLIVGNRCERKQKWIKVQCNKKVKQKLEVLSMGINSTYFRALMEIFGGIKNIFSRYFHLRLTPALWSPVDGMKSQKQRKGEPFISIYLHFAIANFAIINLSWPIIISLASNEE